VLICGTITAIVRGLCTDASAYDLASSWLRSVIFSPKGPWIDNSYWTLSIEVAFYALIMLLLYLDRMNRLQLVIGVLGTISSLLWIAAMSHGLLGAQFLSSIVGHEPLNVLLLRHGCYFAIGVLLWLCLFQGVTMLRSLLLLFCTVGGVAQIVFRTGAVNTYSAYSFTPALPIAVWLLSLAFVVFSVRGNDAIVQMIGPRGSDLLRRIGMMTYPLYLLHAQVGLVFSAVLRGYLAPRVALATSIGAVILAAYLISVYLEPALQRLVRQTLFDTIPMRLSPEATTLPEPD
jgi:peptidoglycan/LPS O-acetylase OafA/YrhL